MLFGYLTFTQHQHARGDNGRGSGNGVRPLFAFRPGSSRAESRRLFPVLFRRGLFIFIGVALLALGMGCAKREMILQRPTPEEQFDPLSLKDDDIWEEMRQPVPAAPETALVAPSPPAVPDTLQKEKFSYTQGFRVQIFATRDWQVALEAKQYSETVLGQTVYLEFEAPYYKLRVGDCPSSVEADELLKRIREKDYPDAFRVRTTIKSQP